MAVREDQLVAGGVYDMYDKITGGRTRATVVAPYSPMDTITLRMVDPEPLVGEITRELHVPSYDPDNRYYYFPHGHFTLAQMAAASAAAAAEWAAVQAALMAQLPPGPAPGELGGGGGFAPAAGAPVAMGGAGGHPIFMNAEQLLEGAEHVEVMKPDSNNIFSMTEFNVGDPVILIYEGGEDAVPQVYKRSGLLEYFTHILSDGVHPTIKNPLTNTVIYQKGQPLPVPNAQGRRIFNNGIIIKTGNIIVREQYKLRSKGPVKPRRSHNKSRRNRKSRRNDSMHRKNRKNMY